MLQATTAHILLPSECQPVFPLVEVWRFNGTMVRYADFEGERWYFAWDVCAALDITQYERAEQVIRSVSEEHRRELPFPRLVWVDVVNRDGALAMADCARGRDRIAAQRLRQLFTLSLGAHSFGAL